MPTAVRTLSKPVDVTVTDGDIGTLARSFRRSMLPTEFSPATVRMYTTAVAQLADFLAERGMPLVVANITGEHISEFLVDVLHRTSAGTVLVRYRGLRAFFKWLETEGEISRNPMAKIKRPKEPEQPPTLLTEKELGRLLAACSGKDFLSRRDLALLLLYIDTGTRRSELAHVTVDEIDLDNRVVRVTGKASIRTAERTRILKFGRKAALAVDRYLRLRKNHPHAREQALWLGANGPFSSDGIQQMIERRATQAGLAGKVHAHLFRHGFAHQWLADGGQEQDLMQLAGWRSRTMLGRYAASAAAERARDAYDRRPSPGDRL